MTRTTKNLISILLVTLVLAAYVIPAPVNLGINWLNGVLPSALAKIPTVPVSSFVLGLDLLGGANLQYEADFSGLGADVDKADAMEGVRDVVERRVNYFGVSEPVVQVSGNNRLIVEIAGVKDVDEAIKLIGETPMLDFREQDLTQEAEVDADGTVQLDPLAGWKPTGLTGKQLKRATLTFDSQTGVAQVSLELDDAGAKLFGEITKRNLGQPVAIFLDGVPISIPVVQSEITDGRAVISGNFTAQEAKMLATRLNSGALPVPIKLISQQRVGASLGEQSLSDSMRAGLWSLLFVAIFMVALYRLPGLTSIVALGVYTLGVLAIYKLLPVTLTLAGIAGFILSLGIGVDANVLIFARMREELKAGKPLPSAMIEGFRRSWPSIRDSHMTTFIGALVLYMFTTSIVRGFALTLGIGVILSLLTSTVVTRTFLQALAATRLSRWRWIFS
jgi:protein-export membrane protein SecD